MQGYIDGYDPLLKFKAGIAYARNEITREDGPTVIQIHPDGRFEARFILQHPQTIAINLADAYYHGQLYMRPGDTLTCYLNWENLMEKNRSRNNNFPLKKLCLMGSTASKCQLLSTLGNLLSYDYRTVNDAVKKMTPDEFKSQQQSLFRRWQFIGDSLIATRLYSPCEEQIIRTEIAVEKGTLLLDFLSDRTYYAHIDTTNQALRVKADNHYYDFLQDKYLNQYEIMATRAASTFINRLEYSPALYEDLYKQKNIGYSNNLQSQLNFLKEQRKRASELTGRPNPIVSQWIQAREYCVTKFKEDSQANASILLDSLCASIPEILLQEEMRRIYEEYYAIKSNGYELPQTSGAGLFGKLIEPYRGKTLFVDFWGTTCGPCRSGIERAAPLREKYRNSEHIKFIYITGERESPQQAYDKYITQNLIGETSYRVTNEEFLYLRELFKFNGIPRYILVSPEGRIINDNYSIYQFENDLKKLFGEE